MTDPVHLLNGKVVNMQGKSEQYPADYAGRVFFFETEQNRDIFISNPRKYLKTLPKLPETMNIAIIGARLSGKHTQAVKLAQ